MVLFGSLCRLLTVRRLYDMMHVMPSTASQYFDISHAAAGGKQDHLLISGCGVPAP